MKEPKFKIGDSGFFTLINYRVVGYEDRDIFEYLDFNKSELPVITYEAKIVKILDHGLRYWVLEVEIQDSESEFPLYKRINENIFFTNYSDSWRSEWRKFLTQIEKLRLTLLKEFTEKMTNSYKNQKAIFDSIQQ